MFTTWWWVKPRARLAVWFVTHTPQHAVQEGAYDAHVSPQIGGFSTGWHGHVGCHGLDYHPPVTAVFMKIKGPVL